MRIILTKKFEDKEKKLLIKACICRKYMIFFNTTKEFLWLAKEKKSIRIWNVIHSFDTENLCWWFWILSSLSPYIQKEKGKWMQFKFLANKIIWLTTTTAMCQHHSRFTILEFSGFLFFFFFFYAMKTNTAKRIAGK